MKADLYDGMMRLPVLAFTGFFVVRELSGLEEFIMRPPPGWDWGYAVALAARLALLMFLCMLLYFHAMRSRPVSKAQGLEPRISALLGMTLSNLLLLLDRAPPSPLLDTASALLLLAGNYLCMAALLHLGRSVSIMAEARALVTSGPYGLVRHPLYLAEQIAVVGVFLQFLSWQAALVLLLHFAFQVRRMINEERVLSQSFNEYSRYAESTPRLIPGIW